MNLKLPYTSEMHSHFNLKLPYTSELHSHLNQKLPCSSELHSHLNQTLPYTSELSLLCPVEVRALGALPLIALLLNALPPVLSHLVLCHLIVHRLLFLGMCRPSKLSLAL